MADSFGFFEQEGLSFGEILRRLTQSGEVSQEDALNMALSEATDVTFVWHAALYALGADHLVPYFRKIEIRDSSGMIGIGMEVRQDFNPQSLPHEDRIFVLKATVGLLRAGGLPAKVVDEHVVIHADDCDGSCGIHDHQTYDPFGTVVESFVKEMDKVLGPDAGHDPTPPGWDQWMGKP